MQVKNNRAHGVTPGLSSDYSRRTADKQAAFLLPYLESGMNIIDIGCGPGTITIGLANAVKPGRVFGIDHDEKHIEEAKAFASNGNIDNVSFQIGDVLSLKFEDNSIDAAFENNVFTHLSENSLKAAKEIIRVLKPNGLFAVRDVEVNSVLWGNLNDAIKQLDKLFIEWHKSRRSNITIGSKLPKILREAGFINTIKSVTADTKGSIEETRSHAKITVSLLEGPFGRDILNNGWADKKTINYLKKSIIEWGEHPDSFFANLHVEVIGWKPDQI
jgi:ubiquinone/menaquinone biosynthesis C-methylase UbiE